MNNERHAPAKNTRRKTILEVVVPDTHVERKRRVKEVKRELTRGRSHAAEDAMPRMGEAGGSRWAGALRVR